MYTEKCPSEAKIKIYAWVMMFGKHFIKYGVLLMPLAGTLSCRREKITDAQG